MPVLEIIFAIVLLIFAVSVFLGVPFMPTHKPQAKLMMDLAEVEPGKVLVDLGSGAGRLLFAAANRGAKAIGYELNPFLVIWTRFQIWRKGLSGKVRVFWKSLYKADLSNADIVVTFLFPKFMKRLDKKIFGEMRPGTKAVSYVFPFLGRQEKVKKEAVYLYDV